MEKEVKPKKIGPFFLSKQLRAGSDTKKVNAANSLVTRIKKGQKFTPERTNEIFLNARENALAKSPKVVESNLKLLFHLYGNKRLAREPVLDVTAIVRAQVESGLKLTKPQLKLILSGIAEHIRPNGKVRVEPDFDLIANHIAVLKTLTKYGHIEQMKGSSEFSSVVTGMLRNLLRKRFGGRWTSISKSIEDIYKEWGERGITKVKKLPEDEVAVKDFVESTLS